MTDQQHPLTPPPELVKQWLGEFFDCTVNGEVNDSERFLATRAAQWGADQELAACRAWLADPCNTGLGDKPSGQLAARFIEARRPKPPSLAEEALELVALIQGHKKMWKIEQLDVVRRALERLQQLEEQQ